MLLLSLLILLLPIIALNSNLHNPFEVREVCTAIQNRKRLEALKQKTKDILINGKVYSRFGLLNADLTATIHRLDISGSDGSLPDINCQDIVELQANNCNLREWSGAKFPRLKFLNLSANALRSNENLINLRTHQGLNVLDLSYNCLSSFQFKHFYNLRELHLQGNLLKTFILKKNSHIFWKLVDLSDNLLVVCKLNVHLNNANTLIQLNRNKIETLLVYSVSSTELQVDAELNQLEKIELVGNFSSVNLSKNLLSLDNVCLSGTFKKLDISQNKISFMETSADTCGKNVTVQEINLISNNIKSIKKLEMMQNTEILHLENNPINSMSCDIQYKLPEIKSIFLTNGIYHFKSFKTELFIDDSVDEYFDVICSLLVILNSIIVIVAVIKIVLWKIELGRERLQDDGMIGFSNETEYIGHPTFVKEYKNYEQFY